MLEGSSDCWVEARLEGLGWEQGDNRSLYESRQDDGGYTCVVAVQVVRNRQFLCMWIYVTHTHIYVKGKPFAEVDKILSGLSKSLVGKIRSITDNFSTQW